MGYQMKERALYQKPAIVSAQPFERLALSCTGVNSGDGIAYDKDQRSGRGTLLCQSTPNNS